MSRILQRTDVVYTGSRVNHGSGPNIIDGDLSTYWGGYAHEGGGYGECQGGSTHNTLEAVFTFPKPRRVKDLFIKCTFRTTVNSGASSNRAQHIMQVRLYIGGAWVQVPEMYKNRWGAGTFPYDINVETEYTDVEKIWVFAASSGHKQCCKACGGSASGTTMLYEFDINARGGGGTGNYSLIF